MRFYSPGIYAAKTDDDRQAMKAASTSCWLYRMRMWGMRLPPHNVPPPAQGAFLCINRYGEPDRWYMRFHLPDRWDDWAFELHTARLVRENGGVYLFTGEEWDVQARRHYQQTWLCAPTADRGAEILRSIPARS